MADKWIQKIHLKKGALTRTASKHGGIKPGGGIKSSFLQEAASGKYGSLAAKRARLAITFKKMHH
jgi:hypothetical protein